MPKPLLPQCDFFGPVDPEDSVDSVELLLLPEDWTGNPFDYVPEEYVLSAEEQDLAEKYLKGDFSGGYMTSQIACCRAPKPAEQHQKRQADLLVIKKLTDELGLKLPESFVRLISDNEIVNRIRHNNIWLNLVPKLVELPADPAHQLLQFTSEGQGCYYFSLLLSPDGSRLVAYCSESIDIEKNYPSPFPKPDIATFEFYQCAASFDEWLTIFFLCCQQEDVKYAELLKQYPGM